MKKTRLLFVVTEDWYFVSHRLDLAVAAVMQGYDVAVATRVQNKGMEIERAGIRLIPIGLARGGCNPLQEIQAVWELVRIYRRERPDIVHHVAMKPVLYGSIAALISRVPVVVNALAGLGFVFISTAIRTLPLRFAIRGLFHFILNRRNCQVIVQNSDDLEVLRDCVGVDPSRLTLIRGSGVDLDLFSVKDIPAGAPLVILPARMLWDKGVGEFVRAAEILRGNGVQARFALVGEEDPANPAAIPRAQLESWQDSGGVEWWGRREDMPQVLGQCHIVCLPSYREGLPKALLEAAASARAIVTTDAPGCREIVIDGENGLLVPVRDADRLAAALRCLIEDEALRTRMATAGRQLVEREFSVAHVASQTLSLYQSLLQAIGTRK